MGKTNEEWVEVLAKLERDEWPDVVSEIRREGMERAAVIASELRSAGAEDDRSWVACRHWAVAAIRAAAKDIK